MPAFDSGFKMAAHTSGRRMADIAINPVDDWQPIVSEVQTAEQLRRSRLPGRRGRERFVVYFEAYTYWTKEAPWNLLAKSGLLSERERLPTVCVVFILRPRGYKPQEGRFQLQVEGETSQYLRLKEVCVWQLEPQKWWEEVPGLMALYPLCRQNRPARQAVSFAAEAIKAATPDTIVRENLLTSLGVFGKLVYGQLDVWSLIGRDNVKDSAIFAEFGEEVRVEAHQKDVLAVLEERFGKRLTASCGDAIRNVTNQDKLDQLLRLAARCASIETFQRGLRAGSKDEGNST